MLGRSFQRRFTQTLMVLVAITGLSSTAVLVSEPMSQYDVDAETDAVLAAASVQEAPSVQEASLATINLDNRHVAAVSEIKRAPKEAKKRVIVTKVDCSQQKQTIITDSPRLRLYSSQCGEIKNIKAVSSQIKNETNGFVATIFQPGNQLFTTDFINLNEGENRIVLHLEDGRETIERELKITRTPSSE